MAKFIGSEDIDIDVCYNYHDKMKRKYKNIEITTDKIIDRTI